MPLLRKTGVRAPWMMAPLDGGAQASADALRQTIVIGALVPAILLGGVAQPIGWPTRLEDTAWPARPAMVVQQPVPVPGANVEQTYAPRDLGAVVQVDHTWPVAPIVGQQPIPIASFWAPSPARSPNTDPLRPPIIVTDPPDPTLVQPSALLIGRLPRDEDVTRPARPASVQVGAQPASGAQALRIGIVHDAPVVAPDRLAQTQVVLGQQPIPGASAILVGAAKAAPTDRLAPTAIVSPPVPLPAGRVYPLFAPRDQVVVAVDRLASTQLVRGQQPQPSAVVCRVGAALPASIDPIRRAVVLVAQPPQPPASGGLLPPPPKPIFISVATEAERIALVQAETRAVPIVVEARSASIAETRRVHVITEGRIVIIAAEDRDGTP